MALSSQTKRVYLWKTNFGSGEVSFVCGSNYFVFYTNIFYYSAVYCMRWCSLLFSIIFHSVIPNSSNHCNQQRIIIMCSYGCIMFYFCVRQNFVCHTKQVASVTSHHWPAKWSSIASIDQSTRAQWLSVHVLAKPSTSWKKKRHVSAVDQYIHTC